MSDTLRLTIAEYLIGKAYRFIEDRNAGLIAGQFKTTREEVLSAAILADRIRRQRQVGANDNSEIRFNVANPVPIDAPIVLVAKDRPKARNMTKRRRTVQGATI